MPTISDSFAAPNNATLDRPYQILAADGATPRDITGWAIHSQWRQIDAAGAADGALALDLTLANGLLALVDAPTGKYRILVPPDVLETIPAGSLAFDILSIAPGIAGAAPEIGCEVTGTLTLTIGATQGSVAFATPGPGSTTGTLGWP